MSRAALEPFDRARTTPQSERLHARPSSLLSWLLPLSRLRSALRFSANEIRQPDTERRPRGPRKTLLDKRQRLVQFVRCELLQDFRFHAQSGLLEVGKEFVI